MTRPLASAHTFLFVPATRPERLPKALASGTDWVIADWEDAVAPDDKPAARHTLTTWLDANPDARLLVRINGAGTAWHEADVLAARHPGIAGLVFPKAETAAEVDRIAQISGKPVLPIIETPLGLAAVNAIAAAQGTLRLVFGKLDLAVELDLEPDESDPLEPVFLPYRAPLVLASRLNQLPPPIDGVYTALGDAEGLARFARRARQHGFGGVLLIHPAQVGPVTTAYTPSPAQLDWAARVVAALDAAGGGTVSLDGRMIDAPVLARARRLLASVPTTG